MGAPKVWREAGRQTHRQAGLERHADRQTGRQADRQAGRQTRTRMMGAAGTNGTHAL